jgi:hypothetical protein
MTYHNNFLKNQEMKNKEQQRANERMREMNSAIAYARREVGSNVVNKLNTHYKNRDDILNLYRKRNGSRRNANAILARLRNRARNNEGQHYGTGFSGYGGFGYGY